MLEFTKIGKHWFRKSKGYWNIEFSGTISDRERWNEPMEAIYEFPKDKAIIGKFEVELPRERLRDHYNVYMEVLSENKIKVGFQLLKEEDLSDWQMAHGGFNTRVCVHAYEEEPKKDAEFISSRTSKVYHKNQCYHCNRIKVKTIMIEGKRLCKSCAKRL